MFKIDNEKTIHISRGDSFSLNLTANNGNYNFVVGDVIKLRVYEKKGYAKEPVLEVSYTVETAGTNQIISVPQVLFGEDINKPKTYWYEISVNEDSTIIAYDEDGAKLFIVYPADETPAINAPNYSGSLDGTIYPRGGQGIGVQSIEQTTTSEDDSGTNEVTVTLTNGETSTFKVKNGSKGSKGDTGPQGPQGEQGIQGEIGQKGDTGPQGIQGIQGPKGDTGPQGPQGKQGIQGLQGEQGISGVSPVVSISKEGKVTTITITDINGPQTAKINDGIDGEGSGDMNKLIYDTNDNGIVDNAEKVNNHTVESDVPAGIDFSTFSKVDETGNKINLSIDNSTYILTATLLDKNNNIISTSDGIDLPLESMVVGASYDNTTKNITLTLQNGQTTSFSVADLVSGLVSTNDMNTALANKEDIGNKTTTITNISTDTQYPSAKAVYDLFNSIVNGDEVSY